MNARYLAGALAALAALTAPAGAVSTSPNGGLTALPPYLQCVPYARQVSGVQIYGDAHTWWGQAEGRYATGREPKVGAVMAFRPGGGSELGHVAAVSRIIDSRTVLISHANWSPINGRRGQIERNVRAVDVSPGNDWSEVRVWYAPIQALGGRHWPISGFIYNEKPGLTGAKSRKHTASLAASAKPSAPAAAHRAKPPRALAGRNDPIGMIIARR